MEMPEVKVDLERCDGCGTCVDVCPVMVFELKELPEYPDTGKSVPEREEDYIVCMACTASCPQEAITVQE